MNSINKQAYGQTKRPAKFYLKKTISVSEKRGSEYKSNLETEKHYFHKKKYLREIIHHSLRISTFRIKKTNEVEIYKV